MLSAVTAFAHRGARTRSTFLVYSALLALALVLLAAWLVPDERAADILMQRVYAGSAHPDMARLIRPELWTTLALADVFACFALGVIAFLVAPAVVAAAVANERRNGTLDQLRTTPQPPLSLAFGFVVGAPARLWLLAAGPLALHVLAAVAGPLPLAVLAQSLAVLVFGALAACSLALCVALAPRQESSGGFAALGVAGIMLLLSSVAMAFASDRQSVAWAFVHPAGALDAAMLSYDGLWRRVLLGSFTSRFEDYGYGLRVEMSPLLSVAASATLAALMLRAACRKLAQPDRPLLSKPLAFGLFALAAVVVAGPFYASRSLGADFDGAAALALSLLVAPALLGCGLYATPSSEAWTMALRRRRPRWSDDAAAPHRLVWLMELAWLLVVVPLVGAHLAHSLDDNCVWALALVTLGALSLPVYLLFATTRYATGAARWGFGVAVLVHCVAQLVAVGMLWGHEVPVRGVMQSYVLLATLLAVAVPSWVTWRQHLITRRARVTRA
jgi:hypothetical protein